MRCPKTAFIFQLPPPFMNIHQSYFSLTNVAKLAVLFEVYCAITRMYGKSAFFHNDLIAFAMSTRQLAIHVAIKQDSA